MARFVVADLTDAKSIPRELETIIPVLSSLPIQPILLAGAAKYSMFEHFTRYDSVLPIVEYPDLPTLVASIQTCIIEPAEAKAKASIAATRVQILRIVLPRAVTSSSQA